MPKPPMREIEDWSALESTMALDDEDRKRIASKFNIDPTNEAIEARIAYENKLIADLHKKYPTFEDDVQKAISTINAQYNLDPAKCSTMEIAGVVQCYIKLKDSPAGFFNIKSLDRHVDGTHDPKYDKAYFIMSERLQNCPLSQLVSLYLHEYLHGAGHVVNTTQGIIERGFCNEIDEGIVDYIASRYAIAAESDTKEGEEQFKQAQESHPYWKNINLVKNLSRHASEKLIIDGYFHGETEELQAEIDNVYGPGAFELFFENPDFIETDELEILSANWKECSEFLKHRQNPEYSVAPDEVDKKIMDYILKKYFRRKMEADFRAYREGRFGRYTTPEGKQAALDTIREMYNDGIAQIFDRHHTWMDYFHEGEINVCNDFVNQAITNSYEPNPAASRRGIGVGSLSEEASSAGKTILSHSSLRQDRR